MKTYLDKKFGSDGRVATWSYDNEAQLLRKLGFTNFSQIDECIKDIDDDHISRTIWDYRQGQIMRFEDVILVGMGESFITNHPYSKYEWFLEGRKRRLKILREAGIEIKSYSPASESERLRDENRTSGMLN